jgi:hypothetical protein
MKSTWNVIGSVLGLFVACIATAPAGAYPVTLTLQNVTFSDGGTAGGTIDLNTYGNLSGGEIITTTGSLLTGSDYVFPSNPSSGYSSGVFSAFAGAYNIVLLLELATPLTATMSGEDAIIGGCETHSFVTDCTADSNTRLIVLNDQPQLVVAEPVTLTTLATAFIGLTLTRRRRPNAAA